MEDIQQLGGNIELAGFQQLDSGSMIILKKIIGNYAKHFSEICENFEKLSLTVKPVHAGEVIKKFEMHGKVIDNGQVYAVDHVDHNIFFVTDKVCKKIKNAMQH
ncbi:hypothetical protein J4410_06585 [Candidatus Woesearchaeota archaeon]|nr:hypothetical protein [Candidatus Woesearchaeota archaeon]